MALAIAFDEAKTNQIKREGDGNGTTGVIISTRFFGARDRPDLPQANFNHHDPGRYTGVHFHSVDQFQVIVDGKGKLGRHDLKPLGVHFARAFTPYGPLVSDADVGLTFFVIRAHGDPGPGFLPEKKAMLKQIPHRQPWQITRAATFSALPSGIGTADTMLQAIPDIKDEQGLAAYILSMKPNVKASAPDPSHGDGQYLVVLKGSLLHDNKERKAPALVFVHHTECSFPIHAGSEGLEAIVLNFPRANTPAAATTVSQAAVLKRWQCQLCAFVYDEATGLPEDGIAPGTRWQNVPEIWSCPDCSASKGDFQMIEL